MTSIAAAGAPAGKPREGPRTLWLALGAIGIVFGDIGTSPIYRLSRDFHRPSSDARRPAAHSRGLSLVFWSMMIVVTIKYVSIIMRADNKGEGGSLRCWR